MDHPTLDDGYAIHPDGHMLVPLHGKHGTGRHAKIDPDDYEKVRAWKWYANHHGYVYGHRYVEGRIKLEVKLHHLVQETPDGMMCDHVNGDRADACRSNLRVATFSVNNRNRRRRGASGFKGVMAMKDGRWAARVKWQGKNWNLGAFAEKEPAARAYDAAALYVDPRIGVHALNFPGEAAPMHPVALRKQAALDGNLREKSSPFYGVHWKVRNEAFQAFGTDAAGQTHYLGLYLDEIDAARAHDAFEIQARGPKAWVNFADSAPKPKAEILAGSLQLGDRPVKRANRKPGKHGFRGVNYQKRGRKHWVARITFSGRRVCLGYFATPTEAARAYDDACVSAGLPPANRV